MTIQQPPQPLAKLQRVSATGRLVVVGAEGSTRLRELYQQGAAKIRLPRVEHGGIEAVLINTAGGLTGGDRIGWTVHAGENADLTVTTQACERIYRSSGGHAESNCTLSAAAGARLAWLPQETILFDFSAFRRQIEIDLHADASLLLGEAVLFGRAAMGEKITTAAMRDRWRVRQDGRLVHGEDFAIGPDVTAALAQRAAMGGAPAMATLLLVSHDAADRLDRVRDIVGDEGGASAWRVGASGKLLARLVAEDGYRLRKRLIPLVGLLNEKAGLPKTWSL